MYVPGETVQEMLYNCYYFSCPMPKPSRYQCCSFFAPSADDCDREEPPSQLESKDATARVYSTPRPKRSPPAPTVWPVEEEYAPPGPPSSLIALGHNEKVWRHRGREATRPS